MDVPKYATGDFKEIERKLHEAVKALQQTTGAAQKQKLLMDIRFLVWEADHLLDANKSPKPAR
jgi:hypothetical protein